MADEVMNSTEAAAYKGCSRTTLSKYLNNEELKKKWFPRSFAMGSSARRTWVIYVEELDKWTVGSD